MIYTTNSKGGVGPEYRLFLDDGGYLINDLKGSSIENAALNDFYKKGGKMASNTEVSWNVIDVIVDWETVPNMAKQFLGTVRARVIPFGNKLEIIIDNKTNQHSKYLHTNQPNPTKQTGKTTPETTIYQRFIWFVERK